MPFQVCHRRRLIDAIMYSIRPLVLLWLMSQPPAAHAAGVDPRDFSNLFLVFLFLFSLLFLLSSMPRALRDDAVSPEILRAFALAKNLREEEVGMPERIDVGREALRRWRSDNPAIKRPPPGSRVFRGVYDGWPFFIDEVWVSAWLGGMRRRELLLRFAIALPDLPPTLEVAPARLLDRLAGRAGLVEPRMGAPRRGNLVAKYSTRPVVRAKERIFLTSERRRVLEEYQARTGGVHIGDGKLFLIRPRFMVSGPDLAALYDDIGELARMLAARG